MNSAKMHLPLRSRLRISQLPFLLLILVPSFLLLRKSTFSTPKLNSFSFCPTTLPNEVSVPTVILQGTGNEPRQRNRTFWLNHQETFLPFDWPLPHRERDSDGIEIPIKFQLRFEETWGGKMVEESNKKICNVHQIPTSPYSSIKSSWKNSKVMIGMSTPPSRASHHLLLWEHWLPSSLLPTKQDDLPILLVLTPPLSAEETTLAEQVTEQAKEKGMIVKTRPIISDRFETRYLSLVKEMWIEAVKRESQTGVKTEWFIFADDDTFFPDWSTVVGMLETYDSKKDILVGALSEAPEQVGLFGKIAFGGAGIFISEALMGKMNAPGAWEKCLDNFGSTFGGDSMVSLCASLSVEASSTLPEVWETLDNLITFDQTLHQLDVRGDGTGFLQSGFLITSLHHFLSWFTLFPPWHYSGAGDLRNGIMLIGSAAKLIGGDNFLRRYVFGNGKVVVHLGYSVVVFKDEISKSQLSKTEHTWAALDSRHPMREPMPESIDKLTYYLTAVVPLAHHVVKLVHTNQDGGRLDIVFDGRGTSSKSWSS